MSVFLKVSQQTVWQLVSKVITSLSTLFILAIISQNYGEVGTGVYTLALAYLAFFYVATDLGLNAHLLPYLVNTNTAVWQKLLGGRILISVGLMILSLIILPLLSFNSPDYKWSVLIGSLTIVTQAIFITLQALYQAQQRYDLTCKALLISTPITVGIAYLLAINQASLPYLFLGHVLGWLVFVLVSVGLIKGITPRVTPLFDLNFLTSSLKIAWPIAATLFLNTVYFRVDVFLISYFRNFSEVGIYNLAYSFFQTALVVPTFIMNSYYPVMLRSKQNLLKVAGILGLLGILGSITTWYLSPYLISLVAKEGFTGSVEALRILSLAFPGFFLSALLMWVLIGRKQYKTVLLIYAVGLIVNVILNYLFIARYTYVASSWITGLTEYLILILQIIILIPLLKR